MTSARVAPEDYNTDCISIFNGKCQNIQSSFCRVHAECFAPLTTPRKTNWLHYQLPNVHLLFCNNKVARICAPLKLIMLYSTPFVEDDAFSQTHKSFEYLWQLLMCRCDEVGLPLLDSVGHAVRYDPTVGAGGNVPYIASCSVNCGPLDPDSVCKLKGFPTY